MKIIKEISKTELRDFLYRQLEIKDKNLYDEMQNPNSLGIFQMNGGTAQRLVNEVIPDSFEELTAVNALSRPGPIENVPAYIAGKNGTPPNYPQKMLEVLKDTYGVPIYQEQIMAIFHEIGGFTLEESDKVRGLMKKLGKLDKDPEDVKTWDRTVKKFIRGAVKNGISENDAERIANDLVSFAGYSFNLSHAASYTYIAVMTLYLSFYFRKYFYSAVLTYEVDRDSYLLDRLNAVRSQGFQILPPDVNKSGNHISAIGDKQIIFGLQDVKNVGEKPAIKIIENRPYESLFDFIIKTRSREVSSRVIEALIKIGAFDNIIEKKRKEYLQIFQNFWKNKKSIKVEEKLEMIWKKAEQNILGSSLFETTKDVLVEFEKEIFGFNFFETLFTDKVISAIDKLSKQKLAYKNFAEVGPVGKKTMVAVIDVRTFTDKNGNLMAFVSLQDKDGVIQSVPIFASYWKFISNQVLPDKLYLMNLFRKEDSILFGSNTYVDKEVQIKRMIKEVPIA